MSSKSWSVALIALAIVAFEASSVSAGGRGSGSSHPGGKAAPACRTGGGNCPGNSWQFLRAENGIFGPTWANANCNYGNGGFGCGWSGAGNGLAGIGYGWGCGYPAWGYSAFGLGYGVEHVPYFAQFPPVYYGYADNMPVLKTAIGSAWAANENSQPAMEPAASANPPRPPLRTVNPYYTAAKPGEL